MTRKVLQYATYWHEGTHFQTIEATLKENDGLFHLLFDPQHKTTTEVTNMKSALSKFELRIILLGFGLCRSGTARIPLVYPKTLVFEGLNHLSNSKSESSRNPKFGLLSP